MGFASLSPLPPHCPLHPTSSPNLPAEEEEEERKAEGRKRGGPIYPPPAPLIFSLPPIVSLWESNRGKMISTLHAHKEESGGDSRPLWKKFFSFSREEEEGFVKGVLFFLSFSPAYLVSLGSSSSFSSGGRNFKALLFLFLSFVPPGTLGTPMRLLRRWRRRRCS